LIVALAAAFGVPGALADGDPASDVLVTENVFVPLELSITRQTELLSALLNSSAPAGFPVRVALIAAPDDLGTATALWRNPVGYSRYLGTELSLAFTGQVVVVMPNGIGVWPGRVAPTGAEQRVASELPAPGGGRALVADGHPLALDGIRVTAPAAAASSSDATEWLVIGGGALLIALSWSASLRARPLQLWRRAAT